MTAPQEYRRHMTLETASALTRSWILSRLDSILSTSRNGVHTNYNGSKRRKEIFNDALNTFSLRLYGVRHILKDHSDSERGFPLPPHELLFPISSKGSFIYMIQDTTYHGLCYTSRGTLTGTINSSMGPP